MAYVYLPLAACDRIWLFRPGSAPLFVVDAGLRIPYPTTRLEETARYDQNRRAHDRTGPPRPGLALALDSEGRAEALATSQSAVDRLDEYPDFHFVRGEAQVYRWIEEENPALFERIMAYIEQGRWHVVNGMVIQPDMNIPSGESFVRQALLGKAYMRDRLGVEPRIAYCVDSFGHAGTLPQILRGCGFDAYVFMRPGAA